MFWTNLQECAASCRFAGAHRASTPLVWFQMFFVPMCSVAFQILTVVGDVTKEEDCNKMVDKTLEKFGRVNIVVSTVTSFLHPIKAQGPSLLNHAKSNVF